MTSSTSLDRVRRTGTALAFFAYPLLAGICFALHPNLLSLEVHPPAAAVIAEFHGNPLLHAGHALMLAASLPLIAIAAHFMRLLRGRGAWLGFLGGLLAVAGAVILAADKGALCLVPSALDTLPESEFQNLVPGIEAMFAYRGGLWLLRLLPVLPAGFILQTAGLLRAGAIPRSQSIPMFLGSLLMMNPEIDLIGLTATLIMAAGFFPYAAGLLREALQAQAGSPQPAALPVKEAR